MRPRPKGLGIGGILVLFRLRVQTSMRPTASHRTGRAPANHVLVTPLARLADRRYSELLTVNAGESSDPRQNYYFLET